jgi:FtsX-like permease family
VIWSASSVARYRLRAAVRRDWAGYLVIVLIVGILGGVAMASVAAARRTQSAFPRILAASNPSDLDIDTGSYSAGVVRAISRLPQVRSAESYVALNGLRALPSGFGDLGTPFNEQVEWVGSLDGLYLDQDRVIITDGRRANPRRAGEIMVSEQTARRFGLHTGQSLDLNLYSSQQAGDPRFNPMTRQPLHRVRLTITGIGVFTDEVVQDDIDRIYRVLITPALTKKMAGCCGSYFWTGLKLAHGERDVAAVQQEYVRRLPEGTPPIFRVTSVVESQGERAVRPESVAAAVFGLIAALIALVLATQAIRRKIVGGRNPRGVLRAVGASPVALVLEAVLGILCAIAAGVVLALGVAVAVSPVAPLGVFHRLEPAPGVSFDWVVLGVGAALFLLVLFMAAVALACGDVLTQPHRRGAGNRRWATVTAKLGLPVAARAGVGFAFEPDPGGYSRPAGPGIFGTVAALVILVGSLVFGASLSNLVSHPPLYGWAWDAEILAGSGYGDIPAGQASQMLAHDPDVAAWSGAFFSSVEINGHNVPVLAVTTTRVGPPVLTGHGVAGSAQILLGPETLAAVGGHVGSTVRVYNGKTTLHMRVTGTATMPAIGVGHGSHLSLGLGAVLPASALSPDLKNRNTPSAALQGPNTILVRFRPGADRTAAAQRLARIAGRLSAIRSTEGVEVLPVQRPAEIVNYRTMGTAPLVLASLLAAGAVVALALSLAASVRRRSRELALLKALGFVRGQLIAAVIWQALVTVAIGTAVGIPLGIAVGRFLWARFAGELYVVPQPAISPATVLAVTASALTVATLMAILPGWRAARTPVADVLRAE